MMLERRGEERRGEEREREQQDHRKQSSVFVPPSNHD